MTRNDASGVQGSNIQEFMKQNQNKTNVNKE